MSHTVLIDNGLIVTMDDKKPIIGEGYVLVEDNLIKEVGEGNLGADADDTIDASGHIVIPGIITAHTHLYGILLRGASLRISPPTDFAQVLQRVWWPVDEALTVDDAYASALSASAAMLRAGSTFFADTYSGPNSIEGSLSAIARAVREIGIRGMVAFEVTERHDSDEARRGLEETERAAAELKKYATVSLMVSVHASFTVSDELIEQAVSIASKLKVPLTIHVSEGLVDLYHNLERHGERTVERLDRLGALGPHTVLAHCVHVNDTELDIIAERNASVAHNPMSNMLNGVGVAPVPEMIERGITVGLGNDGWIFDPFENMRTALTVHRLNKRDPSAMDEKIVLNMATIWGAACYGLSDLVGSITEGKLADLTLIDAESLPTPVDEESVIGHLIHSIGGANVSDVFVGGRRVIRAGQLATAEPGRVTRISRESARHLWHRLQVSGDESGA
ncbi:MAG: amidohydrolase family protein [Candidatus Thorarchaeota archaeon]